MLNQLQIKGFKCFEQVKFDMGNLTLLTGINSAGKSTVIQAILLLLQKDEPKGNPLNGRYVTLGQFQDVKNIMTNQRVTEIAAVFDENKCNQICMGLDEEGNFFSESGTEYKNIDVIYLSAERIGVENVYKQNMPGIDRIGLYGEYAFDYLSKNRMNLLVEQEFCWEEAGRNLGNQVDYWLNYILGYRITAEEIEGTEVVRVFYQKTNGTGKELKPYHVGTGVTYVASVIISALSCKRGSLFMIENPEIHLHPGAQSRILEFFSYLAMRGLQVVIETHSDHIFNGVRKNIKAEKLKKEQVSVYFFRQDARNLSRPVKIRIDSYGGIENQERGLFDQFDDDLDELLGL